MKIAVFLPNWIGDAVMATPALRALRQHFASAHVIGVMKPYVAGVLEGTPWLDSHLYLDSKGPRSSRWLSVGHNLRKEKVDLAVLFPNSFRSSLVAWWGRCRRRVGYARYGRAPLLTDALPVKHDKAGRIPPSPVIDAYNLLAEYVGCPRPSYRMELATTRTDEMAAGGVWKSAGFNAETTVVCLNPGAAFGSAKHWSGHSFAQLAQGLIDRLGASVLVLCGPGEADMARCIVRLTKRPNIYSLADAPMSIGLTKSCVRRADLLITTDSGPRHFAAAFDCPVVTLFGPTHIAWTETYYPGAIHLQKKVECGPCQLRVCPLDHHCMRLLTPSEVFATAAGLMKAPLTTPSSRPLCA